VAAAVAVAAAAVAAVAPRRRRGRFPVRGNEFSKLCHVICADEQ